MGAHHEDATSAGSHVSNDVLRRRADIAGDEFQLEDRVRDPASSVPRAPAMAATGIVAACGSPSVPSKGPCSVLKMRAAVAPAAAAFRFHCEEARTSADQRDRTSDPVEVVRLAAVTARHQPCAEPARRSRGRVLERLDREGAPDRSNLRSALDGLPVLREGKALSTCVVAGTAQLRAHVADGLAIARRGGGSRATGAVGDPLECQEVRSHAQPRVHVATA